MLAHLPDGSPYTFVVDVKRFDSTGFIMRRSDVADDAVSD